MADRKVSIYRRGARWGYMVRVDNKITKSGVVDSKAEAERAAGGSGAASKAKKKPAKKRAKKAAKRKAKKRTKKAAKKKAAKRKAPRKAKKAAKKKAPKRKRAKKSKVSAAACVVSHADDHGPESFRDLCGPKAPRTASRAAGILSEHGQRGESSGRKRRAPAKQRKGATCPPRERLEANQRCALAAALRRDR